MVRKRIKVTIGLDELTALQNRIKLLEQRLAVYEPPEPQLRLIDRDGKPMLRKSSYPLGKPGPKGLLDKMPDSFSREQVEEQGGNSQMCRIWKHRGYVRQDETGQYHKTEGYKRRMYQAGLRRIDNDNIVYVLNNKENEG